MSFLLETRDVIDRSAARLRAASFSRRLFVKYELWPSGSAPELLYLNQHLCCLPYAEAARYKARMLVFSSSPFESTGSCIYCSTNAWLNINLTIRATFHKQTLSKWGQIGFAGTITCYYSSALSTFFYFSMQKAGEKEAKLLLSGTVNGSSLLKPIIEQLRTVADRPDKQAIQTSKIHTLS